MYMCDMTHSSVWDSLICVPWLTHMCDMTHHTCVCHDSFTCVCHDSFTCVCHDSFTCATWLIHMCDMTHWLNHMLDMTHSYMCEMTDLTCDLTDSHVWNCMCAMNESCHTYGCIMLRIRMSHVTYMNASYHTYDGVMSLCFISAVWETWLIHMCNTTHA